jgi:hypothetical protein
MVEQLKTILQTADAVLEKKNKFDNAVQAGVSELQGLIVARLETERTFRRLEAAQCIGEAAPSLPAAKKSAADARVALEQASLKLSGLRTAVGELGGGLVESYSLLSTELPKHFAAIVSAFEAEWGSALTAWNLALGRRQAIEALLDHALDLAEPFPAPEQLAADITRPSETLAALESNIKAIANLKKIGERPLAAGTYYDPSKIHKIVSARWEIRGVPKGSLVCDATFEPGRLSQIIELGEARPVLARDVEPGVLAAASKAAQIDKAAATKALVDSERRLYANSDNVSSRRLDLEREWSHRPPNADPAKLAADIVKGIAAGVEERARQQVIDQSVRQAAEKDEERAIKSAEQKRTPPTAGPKPEWPESLH